MLTDGAKTAKAGRNVPVQREYFSVGELAAYAGLSERTLWGLAKRLVDPIPFYRFGRSIRFKRSEFDSWADEERVRQGGEGSRVLRVVEESLRDMI